MPVLKQVTLFYEANGSWYLNLKKEKPARIKVLSWGAEAIPFNVSFLSSFPESQAAATFKAWVAPGSRALLGPLIGILSAEHEDGSLKGNFNNYKAIMEAGQKLGGIVFAFTPSSVDWEQKIIHGIFYAPLKKRWLTCVFPFPNVVYNRIQDRIHESLESSQLCIRRFLNCPGVTLYNRGFFNKSEVIAALKKAPAIKNNIPATRSLDAKADLQRMLRRYNEIYLKPANDRLGTGIMRVKKLPSERTYLLQYFADYKQQKTYKTPSMHFLWQKIQQKMISSSYLIQQAIQLAVIAACPFDCRVLVQKNQRGRWEISGLGIRIAAHPHSMTTHLPRGGRIGEPGEVFLQAFPRQNPKKISKKVKRLCLAVAKVLEKHYSNVGEMSIDVGLDQNGRPWVFEANAKPMKFDEPEIREKQVEQVIRYAHYLTFKARK
ncbi:MAG: YheC/YheD family protein [Firmicutes bacterium]|nr:YheC/YheD family protein [Bacillota bacterium]